MDKIDRSTYLYFDLRFSRYLPCSIIRIAVGVYNGKKSSNRQITNFYFISARLAFNLISVHHKDF